MGLFMPTSTPDFMGAAPLTTSGRVKDQQPSTAFQAQEQACPATSEDFSLAWAGLGPATCIAQAPNQRGTMLKT